MRDKVPSSHIAEMMALVNALDVAVKSNLVQKGDFVLLQTDCQSAINTFSRVPGQWTMSKDERVVRDKLYGMKRDHNLTFGFRHVKGHTANKEARFVTNNLCDKRAKDGMRLARQRFERK